MGLLGYPPGLSMANSAAGRQRTTTSVSARKIPKVFSFAIMIPPLFLKFIVSRPMQKFHRLPLKI
jgi:hypothetical protein